jgi:hypothetical protein
MTSFDEQIVRCSCCGVTSAHEVLASTNRMGSPDLDQRPPEMMRSTMDTWLQECPSCGYVAKDLRKGHAGDQALVRSEGYKALRTGSHASGLSCRFLLRAALSIHHGDKETVFDHTLSAAWIADDLGLFDAAKTLRRQAAAYVLQAASSPDLRLRLLDVLRRSSEWDGATSLAAEMMAESLEHPLSAIVRFQSDKIKSRDDSCYSVAEALSAAATEDGPDDAMLDRVASFIQILPPKRRGS